MGNSLNPSKYKAKKSLGQNFLINNEVLEAIANAVEPKKGETIVEIGPGHGELTSYLLESGAETIAIEKDARLAKFIETKAKKKNFKIKIIESDALEELPKLDSSELKTKNYKLCGNIPYYITGQLFRIIGELDNKPSLIVFTIQKEVAERICAKGGDEGGMNILSASIQIWAEPEIIALVDKNNFNPVPKVDSAIIRLKPELKTKKSQLKTYYKLLHIIFKQPRKTLLNNLKSGLENGEIQNKLNIEKTLEKIKIDPQSRPQNLDISDLIKLSEAFS